MIRYDKKLNAEINRVIKNYNQKIARLQKLENQTDIRIPQKITKKELKENYLTRRELKRKLDTLALFSERGAEKRTTKVKANISEYELKIIKKKMKSEKLYLNFRIKKMEKTKISEAGVKTDFSRAQIGDTKYLNLKTRRESLNKDLKNMSTSEMKKFLEKLEGYEEQRSKKQNIYFREQYLNALFQLAYFYDYPESKVNTISQKLWALNDDEFFEAFENDVYIKEILDLYLEQYETFEEKQQVVFTVYNMLYNNIDNVIIRYKKS